MYEEDTMPAVTPPLSIQVEVKPKVDLADGALDGFDRGLAKYIFVDIFVVPFLIVSARRVVSLVNYINHDTNTYAIDKIPSNIAWGVSRPFDDKVKIMCKPACNEPIIVWIVGKVSKMWFNAPNGEPAAQVYIHVVPVVDDGARKALKLISAMSKPRGGEFVQITH